MKQTCPGYSKNITKYFPREEKRYDGSQFTVESCDLFRSRKYALFLFFPGGEGAGSANQTGPGSVLGRETGSTFFVWQI